MGRFDVKAGNPGAMISDMALKLAAMKQRGEIANKQAALKEKELKMRERTNRLEYGYDEPGEDGQPGKHVPGFKEKQI